MITATKMEIVRNGTYIVVPFLDERLGDIEYWLGIVEYEGKKYEVGWAFMDGEDIDRETVDDYDWLDEDCVMSAEEIDESGRNES